MHLVQILLPLQTQDGQTVPRARFTELRERLVSRFGGLTAYTHTPAQGLWVDEAADEVVRDDVVVYEVMVDELDAAWWAALKDEVAARFGQRELIVRAQPLTLL